jgi:putative colanic acid biosynthesis acetyltransferase WcaF
LSFRHRACLGDGSITYSLGPVEIGEGATIAQEAYLCTGTHDFDDPALPLITGQIWIAKRAFVRARAFIMLGVHIGENAIVGACLVVTRDVPNNTTVYGNPARPLS